MDNRYDEYNRTRKTKIVASNKYWVHKFWKCNKQISWFTKMTNRHCQNKANGGWDFVRWRPTKMSFGPILSEPINNEWPVSANDRFPLAFWDYCIKGFTSDFNQHNLWWRHQMERFSALLALCAGNSPVISESPLQRPVTRTLLWFASE